MCGGELVVQIDAPRPGPAIANTGMWHWSPWLPGDAAHVVSLGEGATPLVPVCGATVARLDGVTVMMKCEHLNPTGSFKDRIASVAATLATARGLRGMVGTSSGNGGAAAAAYCARSGLSLTLFALSDVVAQKLLQIRSFGARVVLVEGLGHDARSTEAAAVAVAQHAASAGHFPFLTGGRYSPEAMEGAKTIAHEVLAEHPGTTVVYVPVGGGGLLSALGRGFAEIARTNHQIPRLVGVQPAGCATLRSALSGDVSGLPGACTTTVSGLQVAQLFDAAGAVEAITSTAGHLTEVEDHEVAAAQRILARESGLLVEPAGATAFAGLLADARSGALGAGQQAVVIGTGAGYKDTAALNHLADADNLLRIDATQISEVLNDRP